VEARLQPPRDRGELAAEPRRGQRDRQTRAGGGADTFAEVEPLTPSELEAKLYPSTALPTRPPPDCAWIHRERCKRPTGTGVTAILRWPTVGAWGPTGSARRLPPVGEQVVQNLG
jgi:hypothetical protein